MAAAEKFKTPENPAGLGGEVSSTVSQPIPEESEDEGEVDESGVESKDIELVMSSMRLWS